MFIYLCRYGFTNAIQLYSPFNYSCNGDEATLSDCEQITISAAMMECYADEVASAIAVECGDGLPGVSIIFPPSQTWIPLTMQLLDFSVSCV